MRWFDLLSPDGMFMTYHNVSLCFTLWIHGYIWWWYTLQIVALDMCVGSHDFSLHILWSGKVIDNHGSTAFKIYLFLFIYIHSFTWFEWLYSVFCWAGSLLGLCKVMHAKKILGCYSNDVEYTWNDGPIRRLAFHAVGQKLNNANICELISRHCLRWSQVLSLYLVPRTSLGLYHSGMVDHLWTLNLLLAWLLVLTALCRWAI